MSIGAVEVLKLSLHGVTVAYLVGHEGGKNTLVFDRSYVANPNRPTFTLSTGADHPASQKLLSSPLIRRQRLHPVLSNLLPEGVLRQWFAQILKAHSDNEFPLFAQLRDVEFIKIPLLLVFLPALSRQVFVA